MFWKFKYVLKLRQSLRSLDNSNSKAAQSAQVFICTNRRLLMLLIVIKFVYENEEHHAHITIVVSYFIFHGRLKHVRVFILEPLMRGIISYHCRRPSIQSVHEQQSVEGQRRCRRRENE